MTWPVDIEKDNDSGLITSSKGDIMHHGNRLLRAAVGATIAVTFVVILERLSLSVIINA
jgi:hypothetical protein